MSLSKIQNNRLGILLAVMLNDEIPQSVKNPLINEGFLTNLDGKTVLTPKGLDEKNRLCTLAGLNIKYAFEKKTETTKKFQE